MKTLIVDDVQSVRFILDKTLSAYGQTVCLESGEKVVEVLSGAISANDPFDLVLLDLSMPVKDGVETLLDIREYENSIFHKFKTLFRQDYKTYIVILTADPDREQELLDKGADYFLAKPLDLHQLKRFLKENGVDVYHNIDIRDINR